MADLVLTGISGLKYEFWLAPVNPQWLSEPGLYVFVGPLGKILYVGETGNFSTRRPGPVHEKWDQAEAYGEVSVFSSVTQGGEAVRQSAERDLIQAYDPPCNEQHTIRGLGGLGATLLSGRPRNALSGLGPIASRKRR